MSASVVEKIGELIATPDLEGVKTGKIVEIDPQGIVLVEVADSPTAPIPARLTAAAVQSIGALKNASGTPVLLCFEDNEIERAVIVDVLRDRIETALPEVAIDRDDLDHVRMDGETLTFDAKREIVLRCGKASITLTRAGKVLLRGAYLLNRSSGVNRIKGGSVQIN